jgi:hypothetical protein
MYIYVSVCLCPNARYLYDLCGQDAAKLNAWMTEFEATGKLTITGTTTTNTTRRRRSVHGHTHTHMYMHTRDTHPERTNAHPPA